MDGDTRGPTDNCGLCGCPINPLEGIWEDCHSKQYFICGICNKRFDDCKCEFSAKGDQP